jgi:hypothetical protein
MRMIGHVIGALATTATRRSVILSAEGSDARFTFDCTIAAFSAALASEARANVAAAAPPATVPTDLKK